MGRCCKSEKWSMYCLLASADTLGHSFPGAECMTTIRLRMRNGKTTILG